MSIQTKNAQGTLIENHARCLVCDAGKPADFNTRTGAGTWIYLDYENPWPRRVRPFCSQTCADTFRVWPEPQQLTAIFGNEKLGRWLIDQVAVGATRTDAQDAGADAFVPEFDRLPVGKFRPCPDPMLLDTPGDRKDSFCMGCARQVLTGYRMIPVPHKSNVPEREEVSA